ncbi:MAG TPA: YbdK family carboxylate-amine ligase [Saprospiraceae bacterium]|nr:YbdK family carboxylate-amine ligase [Saprospiraceae bacterium]
MYLDFKNNATSLTLGVEMEIQLLDQGTLQLIPRAPDVLALVKDEKLTKEMFRSTLELITGICRDVHDVSDDLMKTLRRVREAGKALDIAFSATGTHPIADYNERILSASPRYHQLLDRNQWLIRRMAVYGLHVHIAMRNGEECIRFMNFFLHFIPHLIALSASSPFWKGVDTGLAASRPTVYEAHPTSGLPYVVRDWAQFNILYHNLLRVGSIESMKDIWWDMRPSPTYGTLEIRICDGPATMLELESIVALIHLLAHWFDTHGDEFYQKNSLTPEDWILRENKWRAIRYGTEAEIINHKTLEVKKLSESIYYWLENVEPYTRKLNYQKYVACMKDLIAKGNSSTRQRKVMSIHNDIYKVMKHNVTEFERGEPIWI